ncbi:hypothetical protein VNO78_07291 [Psophocarpus tetragonolobus]|uniref:Uncharacterized protein n=1 Tax=Psophocarpus tetragonolobus TaxID=3891 RepID=A0AAN9XRT0_PSOTE
MQDKGNSVRLASQSSDHLWLLTVEGLQAAAPPSPHSQRALREAGFTEQRKPLPLDSGGITGCCTVGLP